MTIVGTDGGLAAGYVENLTVVTVEGRQVGRPLRLSARPVELAGREAMLTSIRDRLSGLVGSQPRTAALHGMGGVGKTSVAVEYAHRYKSDFGVVWQFAAEDSALLEAGFARLSALLAATGGLSDPQDPVGSVHAVLADSPLPWLLIFDNAPGPASLREYLPGGGPGQVLITSQHGLWPAGVGIEVPVLELEAAAQLLVRQSRDPDLVVARQLAAELGELPLALEQAGSYVHASGITLAAYRALFKDRRLELLARGVAAGHPANVAVTISVALSRVEQDAAVVGLLRLLACLAPEPVPVSRLLSGDGVVEIPDSDIAALEELLGDQIATGDAVAALRSYSLVSLAEGGMVVAHRLVQAVTLNLMPEEMADKWRSAAAALVEASIPGDVSVPAAWPACAALLPHAFETLDATDDGFQRIANFVGHSGNYPAARSLLQTIASSREQIYGPKHRDTLTALVDLAMWTGESGDAASARDMLARLLPDLEREFGADDPHTLALRGNLAHWTGEAGEIAGARDAFAALLPDLERVLGPQHPATLSCRGNLARWTGETGDPLRARDLYAKLASIRELVLGPDDRSTLSARQELGSWTREAGDAAAARDLAAALLPDMQRVLGAEHPDTLTVRHDLATFTGSAGDAATARDLTAALLPEMEEAIGITHPETMAARNNLAHWTGKTGDARGAQHLYAKLLTDIEQVLGTQHTETLIVRRELAYWTRVAAERGRS